MRRQELGYKRLYSRCWDAHNHSDLPALLELAAEAALTADMLAVVAPLPRDELSPAVLVFRVLEHPSCSLSVAGRYATHPDPTVRLAVARYPGLLTSALAGLALDPDERVRAAAIEVLEARAVAPFPPAGS